MFVHPAETVIVAGLHVGALLVTVGMSKQRKTAIRITRFACRSRHQHQHPACLLPVARYHRRRPYPQPARAQLQLRVAAQYHLRARARIIARHILPARVRLTVRFRLRQQRTSNSARQSGKEASASTELSHQRHKETWSQVIRANRQLC